MRAELLSSIVGSELIIPLLKKQKKSSNTNMLIIYVKDKNHLTKALKW